MSLHKDQTHFILASSSKRRKDLLAQIGVKPDLIIEPNVEETIIKKDLPLTYVKRITQNKIDYVRKDYPDSLILSADTIVSVGRRILNKTFEKDIAESYLKLLSGRRHRVITGISIVSPFFKQKTKLVTSIVKFKKMTANEIKLYLKSEEWKGKAGAYAIQGKASCYINFISGSYSNIVGLPLSDVYKMLVSAGYKYF